MPQHPPPTSASTCSQGGMSANGHVTSLGDMDMMMRGDVGWCRLNEEMRGINDDDDPNDGRWHLDRWVFFLLCFAFHLLSPSPPSPSLPLSLPYSLSSPSLPLFSLFKTIIYIVISYM